MDVGFVFFTGCIGHHYHSMKYDTSMSVCDESHINSTIWPVGARMSESNVCGRHNASVESVSAFYQRSDVHGHYID